MDVKVSKMGDMLLDPAIDIVHRYRLLFTLRNIDGEGPREYLIKAMRDPSVLLAHEAAFALGQRQEAEAVPALAEALEDGGLHAMVRHEAAEALGAIAASACADLLRRHLADAEPEVRETCQLSLHRIAELQLREAEAEAEAAAEGGAQPASRFLSVDPAAAAPGSLSLEEMSSTLLDDRAALPARYAALFGLRNCGGPAATAAIARALREAGSALLRHEVAYVLGQLQEPVAAEALGEALRDEGEAAMVRHEAAAALGAIGGSTCIGLLQQFQTHPEAIVAESCDVALDVAAQGHSGGFAPTNGIVLEA